MIANDENQTSPQEEKTALLYLMYLFGIKKEKSVISILTLSFVDLTLIEIANINPQMFLKHLQRKLGDSQISRLLRSVKIFYLIYVIEAWSLTPLLLY